MRVFHGSTIAIEKPDVFHSRDNVDFGKGFYATILQDQAERWCERFKREGLEAVVSVYTLDETALSNYSVKRFESYSEEWLDFILACRSGQDDSDYDVVEGGVANDRVFNTVELFFEGLIDKEEAIKRLRFEKPNHQICFRSQKALEACLTYEGCVVL